jgi:gliding motility-associated-like protein
MRSLFSILYIIVSTTLVAFGQITSDFNVNADGWSCSDNNLTSPLTVNHASTGGNPGGFISAGTISSQPFFFTSPAKFAGDVAYFSYGQELTFDMQLSYVATTHSASTLGDVQLRIAGGQVLAINLPTFPAQAPAWSTHTIKLDETAGWRLGSTSGPLATQANMLSYLSQVHSFRLSIDYTDGAVSTFSGAIDNVRLNQRTLTPAPQILSLSTFAAKPGEPVSINGSNFDSDKSNLSVYFGGVEAVIQTATSTRIDVLVPVGAQYAPVVVINHNAGRSTASQKPFNPLFESGGRIIRSSFGPRIELDAVGGYGGHTIADMDGDGWADIVVASKDNSSVRIYRNLGTGGTLSVSSFASEVSFPTGLSFTNGAGIKAVDLDGDGKLDMIASGWTGGPGALATFRNTSTPGALSFEATERWNALTDESPVYDVADIDGDGLPDVVSGEGAAPGSTWVTQNISTVGNIILMPSKIVIPTLACGGATFGDLNGDGKPELLMSNQNGGGQIIVCPNTSTSGTISFGANVSITAPLSGRVLVADFNTDGKNDIAWHNGFSANDAIIRLNTNSGGSLTSTDFSTEILLDSDLTAFGGDLSAGDINGDGKADIVVNDSNHIGVFENVFTGGTLTASSFVPAYLYEGVSFAYPTTNLAADLNGDGKPELTLGSTNQSPNKVWIFENRNVHSPVISLTTVSPLAATVGSTVTITGNHFSTVPSQNEVRFGAVKATVLTATPMQLTVTVPLGATHGPVSVTRNQLTAQYHLPFNTTFSGGVASFDNTHFASPVNFTLASADFDIDVADLNNDGKPDIMAEAAARGYAFKNVHSTGPITTSSLIPDDTISTAIDPRLFDLDGDGLTDMIGTNSLSRNMSTPGEITFAAQQTFGVGVGVSFGDLDNDGKIDFTGVSGANVGMIENRTTSGPFAITGSSFASFSNAINLVKPSAGGIPVTGDFNNDTHDDIIVLNPADDDLSIWRNTGVFRINPAGFIAQTDIATGDNPGWIYKTDFDRDGRLDMLVFYVAATTSTFITVFHNQSVGTSISFNRVDLPLGVAGAHRAAISDLDGDGKPDILVSQQNNNRFSIFKNIHTSGALTATSFAAPFHVTVTAPRGITAADLNLDGKPEIILTRTAGFLMVYENLIPSASITIAQQPTTPTNACQGSNVSLTTDATGAANITYQWQKFNTVTSLFENLASDATYTGVATKTLSITAVTSTQAGNYRCLIKGDFATDVTTTTATVVVNNLPSPPSVTPASRCDAGALTLTATGGVNGNYRWYTTASGGSALAGETNGTFAILLLTVTTAYYVSLTDAFCESNRVAITATVNSSPAAPVITVTGNTTVCNNQTAILSAPSGFASYLWSTGATTQQITVGTTGIFTVQVTDAFGCSSPASSGLSITVLDCSNNQPPTINAMPLSIPIEGQLTVDLTILLSDPDNNLDLSTLKITSQPQSGAQAQIDGNSNLQINYSGVSFSGTDRLTIEVCDIAGSCTEQELEIEVIGDITVYNAISPNGDGKNDILLLQYIDVLAGTRENNVSIYNRWGDLVFEIDNYDNGNRVFKGLNNSGNELPSGTYFYKIEFNGDRKTQTGYLILKK